MGGMGVLGPPVHIKQSNFSCKKGHNYHECSFDLNLCAECLKITKKSRTCKLNCERSELRLFNKMFEFSRQKSTAEY